MDEKKVVLEMDLTLVTRIYNFIVAFVKAHWLAILSLGIVLYNYDKPYVSAFVAKHAWAAVVAGNIAVIWAWYQNRATFSQQLRKQFQIQGENK